VQGFHGLLVYADAFWYKHLLEYCRLSNEQGRSLSPELLAQLQLLLKFKKEGVEISNIGQNIETQESAIGARDLDVLNNLPDIKKMISDILIFRVEMNKEYGTNKSFDSK
jgi:hypothetical protein